MHYLSRVMHVVYPSMHAFSLIYESHCDREGKEQIILTCTNLKFPMKPYWILCIIAIAIIVISSSGCAAQTIESATSGTQTIGGITIPTTTGPPTPTEAQ